MDSDISQQSNCNASLNLDGLDRPALSCLPLPVKRRRTPLCRDGGISRTCGVPPLDFRKRTRSYSIIAVPGLALTKRASGVSSGILVHQDYRAVLLRNELSTSDGHHQRMSVSMGLYILIASLTY